MVEQSDLGFRMLCLHWGADMACVHMLVPKHIMQDTRHSVLRNCWAERDEKRGHGPMVDGLGIVPVGPITAELASAEAEKAKIMGDAGASAETHKPGDLKPAG